MLAEKQLEELFIPREEEYINRRKNKIVKKKIKIATSGLIFIAFLVLLFFVSEYALLSAGGLELNIKKQELKDTQLENQRLNMEAKKLESLDRIEAIATTKLGMATPDEIDGTFVSPGAFSNSKKEHEVVKKAVPQTKEENTIIKSIKDIWKKTLGSLA